MSYEAGAERKLDSDPGITVSVTDSTPADDYQLANVPADWAVWVGTSRITTTETDLSGKPIYSLTRAQVLSGTLQLVPPLRWTGTLPAVTISRLALGENVITDFDNGTFDYDGQPSPRLLPGQTDYVYAGEGQYPEDGYYNIDVTSSGCGGVWKDLRSHTNPITFDELPPQCAAEDTYEPGFHEWNSVDPATKALFGKFLAINADAEPGRFFQTSVTLEPNTNYAFQAFISSLNTAGLFNTVEGIIPVNAAFHIVLADGRDIKLADTKDLRTTASCPGVQDDWNQYTASFFSGDNTKATLYLQNNIGGGAGNDIGIDDITLKASEAKVTFDVPVQARDSVLTWTKTADVSTAAEGDQITWTLTVRNSGTGTATGLSAFDTLPTGLSYVSDDGGGSYVPSSGRWSIGTLPVGQTKTLNIVTTMAADTSVTNAITNPAGDDNPTCPGSTCAQATVNSATRSLSVTKTVSNSRPGATTAQAGDVLTYTVTGQASDSAPFTAAKPAFITDLLSAVVDDTSAPSAITADVGAVPTYDSASKTIRWSGPLAKSQKVTISYQVTVADPSLRGDDVAKNTAFVASSASDTTPPATCSAPTCASTSTPIGTPALAVTKSVRNTTRTTGVSRTGDTLAYTISVQNTGTAAYSGSEPARIHDDLSDVTDDATAPAALAASFGTAIVQGNGITWTGALGAAGSATSQATITYSVTVKPEAERGNSTVTNVAYAAPSSATPKPTTCQAPSCASTSTPLGDPALVIEKKVVNHTNSGAAVAQPGDRLDYTVTLTNSSSGDFTASEPATFVDDLSGVSDDATVATTPAPTFTPSTGGQFAQDKASWSGPLARSASVTLTYSVIVNELSNPGDKSAVNTAFVASSRTAPTPTCTTAALAAKQCAQTLTTVGGPRLEVTKSVENLSRPADGGKAAAGDRLRYTVVATNQGNADFTAARPARIKDDLSRVLDLATSDNQVAISPAGRGTAGITGTTMSWSGGLAAGQSVTLSYDVVIKPGISTGTLTNLAYVAPDAAAAPPASCPAADPTCATTQTAIGAPRLAIVKQVANLTDASHVPARAGDQLRYTVQITNAGDSAYLASSKALVVDDLSGVLDDATYNKDAVVSQQTSGLAIDLPRLRWSGTLDPAQTVTLTYTVTAKDYADQNDHAARNTAFGAASASDPTPTTCGARTDCATTSTSLGAPAAQVTKQVSNLTRAGASPAQAGDRLAYTVTIRNTGTSPYTTNDPLTVVDDVAGVSDDAALGTASVTPASAASALSGPGAAGRFVWRGPVEVGGSVTINYEATVKDPSKRGDSVAKNVAFVAAAASEQTPATCVAPGCAATSTPIGTPALSVSKTVRNTTRSVGVARSGDVLAYTLTVENTGPVAYSTTEPARVRDDLTAALDDATGPVSLSASLGAVASADSAIVWTGALGAAGSATAKASITYSLTVKDEAERGDSVVTNVAYVAPSASTPKPATCTAPSCATTVTQLGDPALSIAKSVVNGSRPAAKVAQAGDRLDYEVTLENLSSGDFTAAEPATFVDDLTGILDDATLATTPALSFVPAAGGQVAGARASWSGPLARGAKVTLTYSVVVNEFSRQGDRSAVNTAFVAASRAAATPACTPASQSAKSCALTLTEIGGPRLEISKSVENLSRLADGGKAAAGDRLRYTVVATNKGNADFTTAEPARVKDDLSRVLNNASSAGGVVISPSTMGSAAIAGNQMTWSGALAQNASVSLSYEVVVKAGTPAGYLLSNLAYVAPNDSSQPPASCPATDPTCATTQTAIGAPALRVTKSVANVTDAGHDPARTGDTLAYTLTITNTGDSAYLAGAPALVVDDLTGVLDDATYGRDATASANPGGLAVDLPRLSWSGPLKPTESVTVTYSVRVKDHADQGDHSARNTAFGATDAGQAIPADCATRADCATTSTALGAPGVKIVKQATNMSRPGASPAQAGDRIGYTVTIRNTGSSGYTATDPLTVIDDVTGVADDATLGTASLSPGTAPGSLSGPGSAQRLVWSGPLDVGQSIAIGYIATVKESRSQGDHSAKNVAFAAGKATDPIPVTCADPGCAATSTPIGTPSLSLTKTVVNESRPAGAKAQSGDTLRFSITMRNTGNADFTDGEPARIIDDLTQALGGAEYARDAASAFGSVRYAEPRLTWSGPLARGESASLSYTMTVREVADQRSKSIDNTAFVAASDGEETPTSCEAGSTTCARTSTPVGTPALAVTKAVANTTRPTAATAQAGDVLRYTLAIRNTGTARYTAAGPAIVLDDLSGLADDASYNKDAAADPVGGTITSDGDRLAWHGPLEAGTTVTVTYTATVKPASKQGDRLARNTAIVAASLNEEVPADCTGAASGACAQTSTPIGGASLAITKQVSNPARTSGMAQAGDTLTYSITATNTGDADYADDEPAIVVDDLAEALDDASGPSGLSASLGTASDKDGRITWRAPIKQGERATLTYKLTVKDASKQGDHLVGNVAWAAKKADEQTPACAEATPTCATTSTPLGGPQLAITKKAELPRGAKVAQAGDTVHYTVVARNTGTAAFTASEPAIVLDDLTDVLDDASLLATSITCSSGTCDAAGQTLRWRGPLAERATTTIEYDVRIKDAADQGDSRARNLAYAASALDQPAPTCQPDATTCATSETAIGAPSLSLAKSVTNVTQPRASMAQSGDVLRYEVTVTNSGTARTTSTEPAIVIDELGALIDDVDGPADISGPGDATVRSGRLVWRVPVEAGASATVSYRVTVREESAQGNKSADNLAFLAASTAAPSPNACDPATPDQCRSTHTPIGTPLLSVTKSVLNASRPDATLAQGGDKLAYTITVRNTGSARFSPAEQAKVRDDMSGALDDASYLADPVASAGKVGTMAGGRLPWSLPLDAGESATLSYSMVVNDVGKQVDHQVDNIAYDASVADTTPTCDPNKPQASERIACTRVLIGAPRLTLTKTVENVTHSKAATADIGDELRYTLTARNVGDAAFTPTEPAIVVDDASRALDDTNLERTTLGASVGKIEADDDRLVWRVPLAAGETASAHYSLRVSEVADQSDHSVENTAFVAAAADAATPRCQAGATDCASTVTALGGPRLEVSKSVENLSREGSANAQAGDRLRYRVSVKNAGDASFTQKAPALVVDDLTGVLDDADVTTEPVTAAGATVTRQGGRASWTGPLAPGAEATFEYVVTIRDVSDRGDHAARNIAFVADSAAQDTPQCQSQSPTCAATETPLTKPASSLAIAVANVTRPEAPKAQAGDTLRYTATFTNTGAADYTAGEPAQAWINLAGVLDDASYAGGASAVIGDDTVPVPLSADGNRLLFSAPLKAKASATITFTVKVVDASRQGDRSAKAEVFVPEAGSRPACTEASCPMAAMAIGKPAVAITKTVRNLDRDSTAARTGDRLRYTVTIASTGDADFTESEPARIRDDLRDVLDDASGPDQLAFEPPLTDAAFRDGAIEAKAPIKVGASASFSYEVTVKAAAERGDGLLANVAYDVSPAGAEQPATLDDSGTACPTGASVCARTSTPTLDPAVSVHKSVKNATHPAASWAAAGDELDYAVTVTNDTANDYPAANPAVAIDDLSGVLGVADLSGDASATSGQVRLDGQRLVWSGPLAPGASATITYRVTVRAAAERQGAEARNVAFSAPDAAAASPTECASEDARCDTVVTPVGEPGLKVVKKVAASADSATYVTADDGAGRFAEGDWAPFVIEVSNTGTVALAGIELSDPLVSACSQQIDQLPPGASRTVTCSWRVTGPLTNVATATSADGTSATGSAVVTLSPVDETLPFTGVEIGGAAFAALALIALGLLAIAQRRRQDRGTE